MWLLDRGRERKYHYQIKEEQTYVLNNQDAISSLFHDSYYRYKGNLWDKLYDKRLLTNIN